MRISVNVVLMALLFGLVGQALAKDPSSFTCFDPKPSEKITIDQLLSILGSTFSKDNYLIPGTQAERVFWRLESTKDKDKADAILKQYSVQQLLDLNTYKGADCTDEAFEKRRQLCASFCSQKQASYVEPPAKLREINREEAFTKHNLGDYCWATVEKMRHRCPFRQLLDQMSRTELDDVYAIFLKSSPSSFSFRSFSIERSMKKLARILEEKGPVKSARFWNRCSKVVEIYDAPRSYKFTVNHDWFNFMKFCRAFTNGFTQDGHAKGDLKRV